jgi:hypothetical protein
MQPSRQRLGTLYEDRYRLVVSGGAGIASHTTLEIPLERIEPPADASARVLRLRPAQ